jgi:hypothetical protein
MGEIHLIDRGHEPTSEALSVASARLANGLGRCLDALAVPEISDGAAQTLRTELPATVAKLGLVTQLVDAQAASVTWHQGFASGTAHAFGAIVDAFEQRLVEHSEVADGAVAQEPVEDRVCTEMGRKLADLRFTACWQLVHAVRGSASNETVDGARGYVEGREYALKRAVTSLRARLEDRVGRAIAFDDMADDVRDALTALLYIAVTDASEPRVRGALGERAAAGLSALDKAEFISCLRGGDHPPLMVTALGAAEAHRLSRAFEARSRADEITAARVD